jgi:hypothetical protein
VDHSTINRWVIKYVLLLEKAFQSADATLYGIELHHLLLKESHIQCGKQIILEQFYSLAA